MNDDSKPPGSAKNGADPTGGAEAGQSVADLWAVSYADEDDRELTSSQIGDAIRRGEIDGETIVWRPGMEDWQPLSECPELALFLPRAEKIPARPAPAPPLIELDETPAFSSSPARRYAPVFAVLACAVLGMVWWSVQDPDPVSGVASATSTPVPPRAEATQSPLPPEPSTAPTAPPAAATSVAPPPDAPDYFAFDRLRALRQLAALAEKAARCRGRGTPSGTARAVVTFDPTGQPPTVRVLQAPYAGTPTAQCIVKKLATAKVAPFRGPAVTLRVPVELR